MKQKLEDWIYLIDSGKEWKTTTIMVWVHGNEVSWIDALNNIIDKINIEKWKVYFIYANLKAIKKSKRFIEKNLNRCFLKILPSSTYEESRAKTIMKYLDDSDFLLDIHNTESFNSSLKFLITTNISYSKYFDVNKILTHIDNIQKWWSDGYMDSIWKKWFCLECWSFNFWDKNESVYLAEKSILNFLKVTKNILWDPEIFSYEKEIIKMDYVYKTKTSNFKLSNNFKDFESIDSWLLIALDWKEEIYTKSKSIIIFAHNRNKIGEEWFFIWHEI